MTSISVPELRAAAKQARALASGLTEPARQGFIDLATKWEAEAAALEMRMAETGQGTADPLPDPA